MVLWDFWYFWDYFVKQTDSNVCFLFYYMFIIGSF